MHWWDRIWTEMKNVHITLEVFKGNESGIHLHKIFCALLLSKMFIQTNVEEVLMLKYYTKLQLLDMDLDMVVSQAQVSLIVF